MRLAGAVWPGDILYTTFSSDPLGLGCGSRLDLRDGAAVARLVTGFAPDAVIHTAGSNRTPDMIATIVDGTRHIVAAAAGARLIHLSTDSLFDGARAPYDESAVPAPINDYGRAKATAEAIVRDHANAVIVRTSLIYDLEEMDNGTAWMAGALRAGRPVTLFRNQRRNPVWVDALSRACLELADALSAAGAYRGILNVAGRQAMTRAAFGLRMLDWWGISERDSLAIGEDRSGSWPLDCEMDVSLAAGLLPTPLWGVDEVLSQMAEGKQRLTLRRIVRPDDDA